jgi:hypothetical protein
MGSDDTVAVVISTDNGATWRQKPISFVCSAQRILRFNATTGGQKFVIPLEGYSGTIKIGFYGSEGSVDDAPNYDVFVDSVRIAVCTTPTVALGNDTVLCSGTTLTLDAGNAGSQYQWSNSVTTQTNTVSTAGTYSVLVTTPVGCFGREYYCSYSVYQPVVNLGVDTLILPWRQHRAERRKCRKRISLE